MATVALQAPEFVATVWYASDGRARHTWTNKAVTGATYGKLEVLFRQKGQSAWRVGLTISPAGATVQAYTTQSLELDWEVCIRATRSGGTDTATSNVLTLNRVRTPTPTLTSIVRTSVDSAVAYFTVASEGVAVVTSVAAWRKLTSSGAWPAKQANQQLSWGLGTVRIPVPDGVNEFQGRVRADGSAGWSDFSQARDIEPWWQRPAGVSDTSVSRDGQGRVLLGWSRNVTERAPYTSIEVWRAPELAGDFVRVDTLDPTRTSWTDLASVAQVGYRYRVIPRNAAGIPSSLSTLTAAAGITRPDAPTGVSAVYEATDKVRTSWTPCTSGAKPVTGWYAWAKSPTGAVSRVSPLLASGAVSWLWSPGAGWAGQTAVQAVNAAGTSETLSDWSDETATSLVPASQISASRAGVDVTVSWVGVTGWASAWQVEHSTNGSVWSPLSTTVAPAARTYVHLGAAGGVTHFYRVRPFRASAPAAVWRTMTSPLSAWVAPAAPTLETAGYFAASEPLVLRWRHNPLDGQPQTSATVTWTRIPEMTGGTATVTGSVQEWTLPADTVTAGKQLRWSVVTTGAPSAGASPPPGFAPLLGEARPDVVAILPEAVTASTRIVATWRATWRATGLGDWVQESAVVTLLDDAGSPVDQVTVGAGVFRAEFQGVDRRTYTTSVRVFDGRLWSVPQTLTTMLEVERPARPRLSAVVEGLQVRLGVYQPVGLAVRRINRGTMDGWLVNATLTPPAWSPDSDEPVFVLGPYDNVSIYADHGAGAGVQVAVAGDIKVAALSGGDAQAQVDATWTTSSVTGGQWVRISHQGVAVAGGGCSLTRVDSTAPLGVMFRRTMILRGDESPAIDDTTHFDEHTVREGYVYGLTPDGAPYEAVEVSDPGDVTIGIPQPAAVHTEILRRDNSTWVHVADVNAGTATDFFPRLCVGETYIARAYSEAGGYSDSDPVTVHVQVRDTVLSYGPGWAQHVTAGPRKLAGSGGARRREERLYAGHAHYTMYEAETVDPRAVDVTATLFPGHSTITEWLDAIATGGDMIYRDPSGIIIRGSVQVTAWAPDSRYAQQVGFTVAETGPRP